MASGPDYVVVVGAAICALTGVIPEVSHNVRIIASEPLVNGRDHSGQRSEVHSITSGV